MEEKITFQSKDGLNLVGILLNPEKATNKCVILCHGITSTKNASGSYIKLAEELKKSGYASFRFDFRAHGESDGIQEEMTILKEKEDLEAAVKLIENKGYNEIILQGASFGGGVATLYAYENQDKIKALVLWNPAIDYEELFILPLKIEAKKMFGDESYEKLLYKGYIEFSERKFKIGRQVFDEAKTLKPWECLKHIELPVLFIHGTNDKLVPYEQSERYSKSCKNFSFKTIVDGTHGFHKSEEELNQAIETTISFIKKYI